MKIQSNTSFAASVTHKELTVGYITGYMSPWAYSRNAEIGVSIFKEPHTTTSLFQRGWMHHKDSGNFISSAV